VGIIRYENNGLDIDFPGERSVSV